MWRGRIRFYTPMYWFLGFVALFTFGGMAGVLLATPAADYQLHNTLFLVAHFHTMIVGAGLFGIFAGITYWFPKIFGFRLNEKWGKRAFWLWLIGFFVSFGPLYILGSEGAVRRMNQYPASTGWQGWFIVAAVGVCIIALGFLAQIIQVIVSVRDRRLPANRAVGVAGSPGADPWNGHTLEWATASPVPFYNFAMTPTVASRDPFWETKKEAAAKGQSLIDTSPVATPKKYEDIEMSKNTGMAIYLSAFVLAFGFAMVWHIIWLAALGLGGAIAVVIIRSFDEHTEYILTAGGVERMEKITR